VPREALWRIRMHLAIFWRTEEEFSSGSLTPVF
jgi:hypothetical protein